MSSCSIITMTLWSGPGTVERNMRTAFGMTGLLNLGSAACASFFKKSVSRPGLTSYLKIAITDIFELKVFAGSNDGSCQTHGHCVAARDGRGSAQPTRSRASLIARHTFSAVIGM